MPATGKLDPFAPVTSIQSKKPSRKSNYIKTTITFSDGFVFVACDTQYGAGTMMVTPMMKKDMLGRAEEAHRIAAARCAKPAPVSSPDSAAKAVPEQGARWHSLSENLLDFQQNETPVKEKKVSAVSAPEMTASVKKTKRNRGQRGRKQKHIAQTGKNRHGSQKTGEIIGYCVVIFFTVVFALAVTVQSIRTQQRKARIESVESVIGALGDITPDSREAIEAAEAMLGSLPEAEQGVVSNREELEAARAEYQRLDSKLQAARDALNAVKTPVTAQSESAIRKARKAFDALEEDNLSAYLAQEEKTLSNLEGQWTQACIQSRLDAGETARQQGGVRKSRRNVL